MSVTVEEYIPLPSGISLQAECVRLRSTQPDDYRKLAICLHPWSWLGGTLLDPVLKLVETKALLENGYFVVRFNSRGVGHSQGRSSFSGLTEAEDLKDVVKWAMQRISEEVVSLVFVGYSHGALISSLHPTLTNIKTCHLLLSYPLGPRTPLTCFHGATYERGLNALADDENSNILIIYGTRDEFTASPSYDAWARALRERAHGRVTVAQIDEASHFWRGASGGRMIRAVSDWLP